MFPNFDVFHAEGGRRKEEDVADAGASQGGRKYEAGEKRISPYLLLSSVSLVAELWESNKYICNKFTSA